MANMLLIKTSYLHNEVEKYRKQSIEYKRLYHVWRDVGIDKTDEIDELQRQAGLVWNLYGIPFVEGLNNLKDELKEMNNNDI